MPVRVTPSSDREQPKQTFTDPTRRGVVKVTPSDKKGGGFFGKTARGSRGNQTLAGRFFEDLYQAAVSSPRGFYELGKAGALDVKDLVTFQHLGDPGEARTLDVVTEIGKQIGQDLAHPLRHPGFTALDLLAIGSLGAGTASRVGAAGRAARTGEGAGQVARALVKPPPPKPLTLRAPTGETATVPASRSAIGRTGQRAVNAARNRYPNAPIGLKTQAARVGTELRKQREFTYQLATQEARVLQYKGRKIRAYSPKGYALRAVAEGTPIPLMQQAWREALANPELPVRARKLYEKNLRQSEKARQYLDETGETPTIRAEYPDLAELSGLAETASALEDVRLVEAGLADAEMLSAAVQKPGRLARGAETKYDTPRGAKGRLVGAEDFAGGRYHVGQQVRQPRFPDRPAQLGRGQVMNTGRPLPAPLRKQLTGAAQKAGRVRQDVPSIVARNIFEREKHVQFLRNAREIWDSAADTPDELLGRGVPAAELQAVKAPELYAKSLPQPVQDALAAIKAGELPVERTGIAGWVADAFRDHIFPRYDRDLWQEAYSAGDLERFEGVRWVDRRVLGGMVDPPLLATFLANKGGRILLTAADAINDASRAAILYLRPAYITPNVVGNTFLVLTQQGWAAPINLKRSVLMHRYIGAEHTVKLDALMGQGLTAALRGEHTPLIGLVNDLFARGYGKVVDTPFRRASFLYEAAKAGHKTPAQIKRLLDTGGDDLYQVQYRANRALIDYGDLNSLERAVIRRILFFYPWLKGSTRWTKDYLRDHPQQAALVGQFGQTGEKLTAEELGLLPSWAQGLIKYTSGYPLALTGNPTAAGIVSQPAQLGMVVAGLLGFGRPGTGFQARQLLTPGPSAAISMVSGRDDFGRDVPQTFGTFADELAGVPVKTLVERLTQDQTGRTYPMSPTQALLQFLIGGLAPRTTDIRKLNQAAERERSR